MDLQYYRDSLRACTNPPSRDAVESYIAQRLDVGGTSIVQVQLEPVLFAGSTRMRISLNDYTRQADHFYYKAPVIQYLGIHGILFMTLKVPNGVWTMEQVSRIVRVDPDLGPITWLGTCTKTWPHNANDYKKYRKHPPTILRYTTGWLSWNPYNLYNSGRLDCLGLIKKYTPNYFILEIPAITRNMILGQYILQ